MGIQWIQQTDSHPWLKPEGRINETIQYKECINIPGWSGGARRRKFKDIIEKELLRLKANQALWTIDKFAFFWHDHLVPAYNNYASPGQKSPLEKYVESPDLITPSWSTISVFAEHKEIPELRTDGIIHTTDFSDAKNPQDSKCFPDVCRSTGLVARSQILMTLSKYYSAIERVMGQDSGLTKKNEELAKTILLQTACQSIDKRLFDDFLVEVPGRK